MSRSYVPIPKIMSYVPVLTWRQSRNGGWHADILDTTYPERFVAIPRPGGQWALSIGRTDVKFVVGNWSILGYYDTADAAKHAAAEHIENGPIPR